MVGLSTPISMMPLGSVQPGAVEAALTSESYSAMPFASNNDIDATEPVTDSDTAGFVRC